MKKQNKMILTGYRNPACKLYTPKINNKKRGLLVLLVMVCLVTPCTNWLIPLTLKGISKFSPLWMYR